MQKDLNLISVGGFGHFSFLTVHELKQLVDDSLEELPVGSKEARILAHNVHDVGGYDGLVVLPSFLLTQAEQVLST